MKRLLCWLRGRHVWSMSIYSSDGHEEHIKCIRCGHPGWKLP